MTTPRTRIIVGRPDAPVLDEFMRCRDRVSMIMGPLGSAKTYSCLHRLLMQATEQAPNRDKVRPTRWAIVRNTYVDLAATTMKDFREVFIEGKMGRWILGGIDPPTFKMHLPLSDGTVAKADFVFMALDLPKDVKKLRGFQATGAWLNEVKELAKPNVDMMDGRIGRYPSMAAGGVRCSWHGLLGDTNAPDEDSWYYELAEDLMPDGWRFFRQPGGVTEVKGAKDKRGRPVFKANPKAENIQHLPDGYYMNQVGSKDPAWVRINLANEYGFYIEGKPVHPDYVDSVHCPLDAIEVMDAPIYLGIDFGRTPAAAIIQVDQVTDRKLVIDEFVTKNMSASIFGPELNRYLAKEYPGLPVRGWGDPAGDRSGQTVETTPIQLLRAAGLPVEPAQTNVPLSRRTALARPLRELALDGLPRVLVSKKAKMIRKGLMGGFNYRRLQVSSEKYSEEPDKNAYSHPVEGLEYGMLGLGEFYEAVKPAPAARGHRSGPYLAVTP